MKAPPASRIAPHASRTLFTGYAAAGGLMLAIAAGLLSSPVSSLIGFAYALLGGGLLAWGVYGRAVGAGVQVVNTSFNLIALGRFAEAEELLTHVETRSHVAVVHKAARVQRALIALRRGNVPAALGAVDSAVVAPLGLLGRAQCRMQTTNARAIRAFLRASTGDREGAASDVASVRSDPIAIPQALARASLAEAILLERSGDRTGLREHLLRDRTLLLQATDRRERSIVRAYQRMLKTTATTPYRKPAPRDRNAPSGEEPSLADWIEKVVPGAAAYVSNAERQATKAPIPIEPIAAPTEAARKAVIQARTAAKQASPKPRQGRFVMAITLAMVFILIVVVFFLIDILAPGSELASPSSGIDSLFDRSIPLSFLIITLCALFIGIVVVNRAELRKQSERLVTAAQWVSQGRTEAAEDALASLTSHRFPTIAASAHLTLAVLAERRADLAAALSHCDRGLGRLANATGRIAASDILLPELIAERAFLLVAMDRTDEAHAEMASIPDAFPYLARTRFRTHLLALVRRNDLSGAAAFAAEHSGDLPLNWNDELLADAACAAVSPELAGAAELGRIREEVRNPETRRWIETLAPNVLAALETTDADPTLPAPGASAAGENIAHAAETETLAEEEAARAAAAFQIARETPKAH